MTIVSPTNTLGIVRLSVIERCDERVDLVHLLNQLGYSCPEPVPHGSVKIRCIDGWVHRDGGVDRSMRVYSTNTAWCFSCHKLYTPSLVGATVWHVSRSEAARRLLREAGLRVQASWQDVSQWSPPPELSKPALLEALRQWMRAEGYAHRSSVVPACAAVLDWVDTPEQAGDWLDWAKCRVKEVKES